MPNGYSDAIPVFTKILKPVYANLTEKGHLSAVFVEDSYLQGDTETECLKLRKCGSYNSSIKKFRFYYL